MQTQQEYTGESYRLDDGQISIPVLISQFRKLSYESHGLFHNGFHEKNYQDSLMEQFGLLRIEFPSFDESKFQDSLYVLKGTQYSLSAHNNDAPGVTHCVSAVRYIIQNTTGYIFPPMYIGDMSRNILDAQVFPSRIIPLNHGEMGDLIFFRGRTREYSSYMVTHVGILLNSEYFFHSTYGRGGVIDGIDDTIARGHIASCDILSRLTDPRSK